MTTLEAEPDVLERIRSAMSGSDAAHKMAALKHSLRAECKRDLWFFAFWCCGYKDIRNSLHREMSDRWMARKDKRLSMWLIPRSHLKTSLWTIAGTLWEFIQNKDLQVCIFHADYDSAADILAEIKEITASNDVFRFLFPEYCHDLNPVLKGKKTPAKDRFNRHDFPCSKHAGKKVGNIRIGSSNSAPPGHHYDLILYDDIIEEDNINTKDLRDKMQKWFRLTLNLRVDPSSRMRIIGTRWHYDDQYGRMLKAETAYREMLKSDDKTVVPKMWIYRRKAIENGTPIWHERFTYQDLMDMKAGIGPDAMGSYLYSCQMDNEPLPEECAKFKREDIQPIEEWAVPPNCINFMAVDLARSHKEIADYSVATVASFDGQGGMYVREIFRDHCSTLELLSKIQILQQKWGCERVAVETDMFQEEVYDTYKREAIRNGWDIPWVPVSSRQTQKFIRTLGFTPRVERGDFYYVEDIVNAEWMIEEMITFPKPVNDDILDTLVYLDKMHNDVGEIYQIEETVLHGTYAAEFDDVLGLMEDTRPRMECSFIGADPF